MSTGFTPNPDATWVTIFRHLRRGESKSDGDLEAVEQERCACSSIVTSLGINAYILVRLSVGGDSRHHQIISIDKT